MSSPEREERTGYILAEISQLRTDNRELTAELTVARAQVERLRAVADAAERLTDHIYTKDEETVGWLGGYALRLALLKSRLAALHSVDEGEGEPDEDVGTFNRADSDLPGDYFL